MFAVTLTPNAINFFPVPVEADVQAGIKFLQNFDPANNNQYENIERLLTQKQLAVWDYLQKVDSAAPRGISEETKVAYPTVRQAIDKLMLLKKIERIGQGRSTSYRRL